MNETYTITITRMELASLINGMVQVREGWHMPNTTELYNDLLDKLTKMYVGEPQGQHNM